MKRRIVVIFAVLLGIIIFINLCWICFYFSVVHYADSLEYNRISQRRIEYDYANGIILTGFNRLEYLRFQSLAQVISMGTVEEDKDELILIVQFPRRVSYEYHFYPGENGSISEYKREIVISLGKDGSLKRINDYDCYDSFRDRIETLIAIARKTWGLK